MHELRVTQHLLDLALEHAGRAAACRVTDLYLKIGALSSVVDESVQFYWDIISAGTLCEGARLHFERVPARLRCQSCGHEYLLEEALQVCPVCRSHRVEILAGTEFLLERIEVEMDEVPG